MFLSQGRHGIMMLESTAMMTSPREDAHTSLIQEHPVAQVQHSASNHS